MSACNRVYSMHIFCSAWAIVSINCDKVFKNEAEKFTSQPMGGHVKNHSTGLPRCITVYMKAKHANLSDH